MGDNAENRLSTSSRTLLELHMWKPNSWHNLHDGDCKWGDCSVRLISWVKPQRKTSAAPPVLMLQAPPQTCNNTKCCLESFPCNKCIYRLRHIMATRVVLNWLFKMKQKNNHATPPGGEPESPCSRSRACSDRCRPKHFLGCQTQLIHPYKALQSPSTLQTLKP